MSRSRTAPKRGESLTDRVEAVLHTLKPLVHRDGGDIELVQVDDDGVVHVRLLGACIGCPSSTLTLALGIERNLKEQIPEVSRVVCA